MSVFSVKWRNQINFHYVHQPTKWMKVAIEACKNPVMVFPLLCCVLTEKCWTDRCRWNVCQLMYCKVKTWLKPSFFKHASLYKIMKVWNLTLHCQYEFVKVAQWKNGFIKLHSTLYSKFEFSFSTFERPVLLSFLVTGSQLSQCFEVSLTKTKTKA